MNQPRQTCPAPEQLTAFANGRLSASEQAEGERHVAHCASCCQALRRVPDDTLIGRLRAATTQSAAAALTSLPGAPPVAAAPDLEVPPELANHPRYRILEQLGAGGMGVVYLAEHRLMERPVALKVINRALTSNAVA